MEHSRSQVALFTDADNSTHLLTPSLLAEAEKFGEVSLRRVYGNWRLSSLHVWQEIASRYRLEQRPQRRFQ
jgi:hypothetical protein